MILTCTNCGKQNSEGSRFCQGCGHPLNSSAQSPFCPVCNKTYAPGTNFCEIDGARLIGSNTKIARCTICNTVYPTDVKFCPADGGEVRLSSTNSDILNPQEFYSRNAIYPKASLENRFLAAILDGLISLGLSIPTMLFYFFSLSKSFDYDDPGGAKLLMFMAILFYLIPLTYAFIQDGLGQGQSWGKRPCNLMVIDLETNTPCGKGQSFVRNLISGLISIIPFVGWLVEPIIVLASKDGRKLGDRAANTQVIDTKFYNQ